jgi:hypothetical protein
MIRLRILKIGLVAILCAAFSQGILSSAHAQTVELRCTNSYSTTDILYVSIDMSAQSVNWWGGSGTRDAASNASAAITDSVVTWEWKTPMYAAGPNRYVQDTKSYTLDRATGSLSSIEISNGGTPYRGHWECKKATSVF